MRPYQYRSRGPAADQPQSLSVIGTLAAEFPAENLPLRCPVGGLVAQAAMCADRWGMGYELPSRLGDGCWRCSHAVIASCQDWR